MSYYLEQTDEVAKEFGYEDYEDFDDRLTFGRESELVAVPKMFDEIAKRYAQESVNDVLNGLP